MRTGVTIILALSGFLILARGNNVDIIDRSPQRLVPRQASASAPAPANSSPAAAASSAPSQAATSQAQATSAAPASSAQPQQTSTPAQQSSAAQQQQSSSQAPATSSNNNNRPTNSASNSAATPTTITSALVTTNPSGQVVTSIVIVADTPSPSASSSQSAGASSSNNSGGGGSGVGTSTIVGLSVAGGVAVLCVIGFFVWKFTRKRIGAYDNNEEIKWPELNAHDTGVPLPTHRTGGSGFDTAPDANRNSIGYADSIPNSTAEFPDPYAIPPLPHLDPNQPYRDDPSGAFYDPYRGPVPQSFNKPVGPGEVIPMTQLAGAGRRSPGPGAAYGDDFVTGRASPGPGRVSPAPPGSHAAYGSNDFGGGRASPGPRAAQQGRVSPGPQAAYGNVYNPR